MLKMLYFNNPYHFSLLYLTFMQIFIILSNGSVLNEKSHVSGADFTKGLKPRFRLKFETLVLNFVNRMLSLWS